MVSMYRPTRCRVSAFTGRCWHLALTCRARGEARALEQLCRWPSKLHAVSLERDNREEAACRAPEASGVSPEPFPAERRRARAGPSAGSPNRGAGTQFSEHHACSLRAAGTDTEEGAREDGGELTSFSRSLSTRSTISTSDLSFIQATMSCRERPALLRDISSLQKLFSKRRLSAACNQSGQVSHPPARRLAARVAQGRARPAPPPATAPREGRGEGAGSAGLPPPASSASRVGAAFEALCPSGLSEEPPALALPAPQRCSGRARRAGGRGCGGRPGSCSGTSRPARDGLRSGKRPTGAAGAGAALLTRGEPSCSWPGPPPCGLCVFPHPDRPAAEPHCRGRRAPSPPGSAGRGARGSSSLLGLASGPRGARGVTPAGNAPPRRWPPGEGPPASASSPCASDGTSHRSWET